MALLVLRFLATLFGFFVGVVFVGVVFVVSGCCSFCLFSSEVPFSFLCLFLLPLTSSFPSPPALGESCAYSLVGVALLSFVCSSSSVSLMKACTLFMELKTLPWGDV